MSEKDMLIEKKIEQDKKAPAVKAEMGLPVAYDPAKGPKGLKALIRENFDYCNEEIKVIRKSRAKRGLNASNSPVVYAAKILQDASEVEISKMYFLRVVTFSADGGQAHATAMQRFKGLNCVFLDYDLPSLDAYKGAIGESQIYDKATMQEFIKKFAKLKEYLDEEIEAKEHIERNEEVLNENAALKAKLKEMEEKNKKQEPVKPEVKPEGQDKK